MKLRGLLFATAALFAAPVWGQTVGTYTEAGGAVKNQIAVVTTTATGATITSSAALADGSSNTQARSIDQTYNMVYNGTTWDRMRSGITADANATTGLLNTNSLLYNGSTWDRARGDVNGSYVQQIPSALLAAGITPVVTSAVGGSLVVKASAGNLYGVNVVAGASAGFVLIYNTTTAPVDGAVTPVKCLPLAANAGLEIAYRDNPTRYSTGITVVFSTTGCFSQTISATAFISAEAK